MPDVALVTARVAASTDADLPPLLDALAAQGLRSEVACWDDPDVDWGSFAVAVLRSPWDYVPRYREFLAWLDRAATETTVLNPPDVVRWSTDKHYLADLAAAGVPVVPTRFCEPGGSMPAVTELAGEVVVKPVISAGSKDTIRHTAAESALTHAAVLLDAGRSVMIQPYLDRVDRDGETGLVYFDGSFSHAFRKGPILRPDAPATDEFFAPEEITLARRPGTSERRPTPPSPRVLRTCSTPGSISSPGRTERRSSWSWSSRNRRSSSRPTPRARRGSRRVSQGGSAEAGPADEPRPRLLSRPRGSGGVRAGP